MAAQYSIPWISRQLQLTRESKSEKTAGSDVSHSASASPRGLEPVKTFVLFVRLPNWKKEAQEICTLRKVKDFTQVFQVKQLLELSAGIPAHAASLHMPDDTLIPDDTSLILGKNVANGYTMHLKASSQWEPILRSVWKGSIVGLMQLIKSAHNDGELLHKDQNQEKMCTALFLAASRGDFKICKELLKNEANPNYTTIFGNGFLHCAAFKGNLQILQLLVACGANVRSRNIQNQSALDVAVAVGFVECAKWLWLHQWSIRITKSSSEDSPKLSDFESPSKTEKPDSTPYRISLKKQNGHLVKPATIHHSSAKIHSARPKTAPVRKQVTRPVSAHPTGKKDINNLHPSLVPEIALSLKREKSIPSIHECRSSSYLNVGIHGKINPLHSYDDHFRSRVFKETYSKPQPSMKDEPPQSSAKQTKHMPEQTHFKHMLSNLHGSSNQVNTKRLTQDPAPRLVPTSVQIPIEAIKREVIESVGFDSASGEHDANVIFTSSRENVNKTFHDVLVESRTNLKSEKKKSEILDHQETNQPKQASQQTKEATENETILQSFLNKIVSPDPVPKESEKKSLSFKFSKPSTSFQATREKKRLAEEEELKKKKAMKEKNDKAYNEWLAMKQRETIAKRKSEILNSSLEYRLDGQQPEKPKPIHTWGITYEEWLKSKGDAHKTTSTQADIDERKRARKKPSMGKSFEEWISDKNKQASESQIFTVDKTVEDDDKLIEMRKRKFDNWVSNKSEAARKERRKTEQLEQAKLEEMQKDYAMWKSKPRVMSFEQWRKRKQNERRLSAIDQAQHGQVEHLDVWVSQEREVLAERAFRRWLLKKQGNDLQRAQSELKEARKKRVKVEAKIQLRLERLRARKELRQKQRNQQQKQETDDHESSSSDEENLESLNNELTAIDNQIKNMSVEVNDKMEAQQNAKQTEFQTEDTAQTTPEQTDDFTVKEVVVPKTPPPDGDQNELELVHSPKINISSTFKEEYTEKQTQQGDSDTKQDQQNQQES